MKIIIIGAGIAGLSSYLFLHKHLVCPSQHGHTVRIYEAYDVRRVHDDLSRGEDPGPNDEDDSTLFTPKVIGAGIGIGKNGLSVLRRMDSDGALLQQILRRGNSVSRWRMGTARGWRIVDASVQASAEGNATDPVSKAPVNTVMIARQAAWKVLSDAVLTLEVDAVTKKKAERIESLPGGKIIVHFTDGARDDCDLLIGADGLRSIVRQAMFTDHNDHYQQSWYQALTRQRPVKKDYITPHYEGLTGVGGFVPASVLDGTGYDSSAMSITFGPNGFFGHGYIGAGDTLNDASSPLAGWWSTFSSNSPKPYQTTNNGDPANHVQTTFDRDVAMKDLLDRHRSWKEPAIQAILSYLEKNMAIEHMYPTYTTPELPTWTSKTGNMVLVGDAAHALQPSSGQGACQALEDSEALALLLRHYLGTRTADANKTSVKSQGQETGALAVALQKFVDLRKPRIAAIYVQSQKMSRRKMDMGIVMEYVMYVILWLATKLQTWKKYNDALFDYDLPAEVDEIVKPKSS